MSDPRVLLLYSDGCPNWRLADERIREALAGAPTVEQLVEVMR